MAIEGKMRTGAILALILACQACPAIAAETAFGSQPVKSAHSSARLLSAGAPAGGTYHLGVEIDLEPKTITYWRQPGDAGSPPKFDFSGSKNVAAVEVLYPAPKHIIEAESEVAGYDTRVIFPVRVTPGDPAAPVSLRLALDYAACGTICLPAKAELSLILPKAGASPYADAIAAAESRTPKRIAEAEAKKLIVISRPGGKNERIWNLRYTGPGRAQDLFIEAPEPLFIEAKRSTKDGSFDLRLDPLCCAQTNAQVESIPATITILTDNGAIEAPALLD
jgi:DsbC/DsbD-like thiol-disulfide interchange protein